MSLVAYPQLNLQNTSKCIIRCPFDNCRTRIIALDEKLMGTKTSITNGPKMTKDSTNFFEIEDVWQFDNIGVSRPTEEIQSSEQVGALSKVERLLICSECDKGPLGFAGYRNSEETDHKKLNYYLSCESVLYEIQ